MDALLSRLQKLSPERRALLARAIRTGEAGGAAFPVSFAQRRLWFLHRWDPGSPAYNLPWAARLAGRLDVAALERSLRAIVRRHEVLRTAFVDLDGEPVQVIREDSDVSIPVIDLSGFGRGEREARVEALAVEEARRPFDLMDGLPLRVRLLRCADEEHVLLLVVHHIAFDGWSMGILLEELAALYAAFAAGRPPDLPEPPIQYADFARWQRAWIEGEAYAQQLAYWRERLAGAPGRTELPEDRPRPAARTDRGAAESLVVSATAARALRELGAREGATLFMTLLAAFDVLLLRCTGQEDVVVGTPIANRNRAETERLIGFFVNTLVLRTDLSGDPTFREALARVRDTALGAYANQDVPFETLVEELAPGRDPSQTPLFQTMFVVQNAPARTLELPGLTLAPVSIPVVSAKFDLTLSVEEDGAEMACALVYSTDLFEASSAARLLGRFRTLLEAAAAGPDRRISDLPLLSADERRLVCLEWNDTSADYPRDATIHSLFEAQVERSPGSIALALDGEITYRELDRRANGLARRLRALGVRPEDPVVLCVERSFAMVAGMLGILKAGGAYVPLDPDDPPERLALLAEDAGARAVVAPRDRWRQVPGRPGHLPVVDPEEGADQEVEGDRPSMDPQEGSVIELSGGATAVDPERGKGEEAAGGVPSAAAAAAERLAYIIHTSGSTGRPKAVAVSHRSVVRLVREADYADLGPDQVFLQLAPIAFDASVFEIWGCLLNGGRLAIMPPGAPSLEDLGRAIERHGVTTLWLTAPLFHQVVDRELESLRSVRQVLAGGDVLSPARVERALEALPLCRIVNGYGPTETTTFACCCDLRRAPRGRRSVPIGRPIRNTRAYVLDARLRPAPIGVCGDLFIAGDGLARGYLRDPAMTADRFVPDPRAARPGERMFRSGDRARWLEDGTLEFLGRRDHQVKIRGYRIEPGEVESVLCGHPRVAEAAVVAREDGGGERRLVGYVVVRAGPAVGSVELRRWLKERLPDYLVPGALVELDTLPRTPSGKLDRRELPEPMAGSLARVGKHVAPRSPVEEVLAGIWGQVLGVERVGVEDDFFELGGHSLLATQVVSRGREGLGVELPLRAVFERPVLRELAAAVEEALRAQGGVEAAPIVRVEREGELPLSFAQERLWFLDQLEPGGSSYNVPGAVRLSGELDRGALESSLDEIVRRHEAVRTTFAGVAGRPVQVVGPAGRFDLEMVDLSGWGEEAREAEAGRVVEEAAGRPFDLGRGPLMRAGLVRLGETEHVLWMVMHHIVSDGWSLGVFMRELSVLYGAYRRGEASPLGEPAVQYADYAVWQRRWLGGKRLEGQLAYWRQALAGAPYQVELQVDRARPAVSRHRGGRHRVHLSGEVVRGLREVGRREGATLYMVVLAGFEAWLHRYTGQEDVLVGTPIANRTRGEVEGLIGFFVNTLVMRGDVRGDPRFRELVGRVKETALGAYAHQDLPFERLVEELQPERDLGRTPLFQVMFALQNAAVGEVELEGLEASPVGMGEGAAKFDLTLSMVETEEGLEGVLEYDRDLFESATVERMGEHLERLLAGAAAEPEARVSELPLMGEAERRRLLEEWSGSATTAPAAERCVHELFEEQAGMTPEAVAVRCGATVLTYGELRRRAGRLARHLRDLGVRPESRVGLLAERSPGTVAGMLGILEAGGAFVPLDPDSPPHRLALLMDEARASLLVSASAGGSGLRLGSVAEGEDRRAGRFEVVPVDGGLGAPSPLDHEGLPGAPHPGNLAYVVFTSGSTGRPKAVGVEHGPAARHFTSVGGEYGLRPEDRVLQFGSLVFDASLEQVFASLLCGATVVLRDGEAWDARRLLREVRGVGITVLNLPTAYWHAVAAEMIDAGERLPDGVPRLVIVGGEAARPEAVRRWRRSRLGSARLLNGYGPTEAVITAALFEIPPAWEEDAHPRMVPIGRPAPGRTAYVLDRGGAPVPAGVPGELFLGGGLLSRGYLDRPDATAEAFVPDPFARVAGARLYRTGDRARWLEDGTLEFLGRLDHQVKIRGYRVEPGEVEAALSGHPGVAEAAVVAREDGVGELRLVGYVVLRAGSAAGPVELRRWLKERLPDHMVPPVLVEVESLPRTPSGKLDRRALPELEAVRPAGSGSRLAPRSPVEEVLAGIWGQVLGLERVGVEDDFFALGGHSLLATQVVSRVREGLGVELPLRAAFERPALGELAAAVEEALRTQAGLEAAPIVRVEREGELPLSFAQERLWFLDQLEPGGFAYNVPGAVRLSGELDVAALERSLGEIVRRHEALRTTFASVGGRPVQVIVPAGRFDLEVVELGGREEGEREREAEAGRVVEEASELSFDLGRGPLLRAGLVRLSGTEHVLWVVMHHIVSDGWSLGVFLRELGALYGAYRRGESSPLEEPAVQYADYAVWQRRWLGGERLERQLAYWKEKLAGAPPRLELPADYPRPAVSRHRGGRHRVHLSGEVVRGLRELGRRERATLYMVVLAGFEAWLHRYTGQQDVPVGTPIANRTRGEVEGLIGFFVNTLVMRGDLSRDPRFRELVVRVRETALGAYAHQDLPFERLVEELQPERDLGRTPLFQVMFALQNAAVGEVELSGLEASPVGVGEGSAKFDLTLSMVETEAGLEGVLEYDRELFEAATAERMGGHLERLLAGAAAEPESRVSELPLMGEAERRRLLVEWSGSATAAPAAERCVHELFEEQAGMTPEAVAVRCGETVVTYGELRRRAGLLARHLRDLGVGPESRVGLLMERSPELLIGMLAILEAGGAFVPLDPAFPPERLELMVRDARAAVVLAGPRPAAALPGGAAHLVALDGDGFTTRSGEPGRAAGRSPRRPGRAHPRNLVYVIYTSGSTGVPKGVGVEHRSLASYLMWVNGTLCAATARALPAVTPPSFDASLKQLLAPLLRGDEVWMLPEEVVARPADLLGRLARREAVGLNCVPSLWAALLDAIEAGEAEASAGSLRALLLGGERIDAGILERTRAALPGLRVWNLYGPTEATANVAAGRLEPGGPITIGRPVAGARIYLLDGRLDPVPPGCAGELCVGGVPVARGYLGDPERTAERFVPDRFGGEPGARLYRTGDRARFLPDGNLDLLGRLDRQVKVRGVRIEPAEIEAALLQHPGVEEAAVVAHQDASGAASLAAYVVPKSGHGPEPAAESLRRWLGARLPASHVPPALVLLESLPRTRHGKLDRRALHAPDRANRAGAVPESPRTPGEVRLAALWAEVLGAGEVGIHDDFFELGGHSLLATRLVFAVREAFGVDLPLRQLFESPTVAGMMEAIEALRAGRPAARAPAVLAPSLEMDASLDEEIRPEGPAFEPVEAARSIFLTGATGFVGAFLLHELLRRTEATVHCLVRSPDAASGRGRIRAALETYSLWRDDLASRIVPVPGDLTSPRLGLPAATFDRLAAEVDAIYHGGAQVNLLYPYDLLKAPNVLGTREVLRLACRSRTKPVHHVSTVSVFASPAHRGVARIHEGDAPARPDGIASGYACSKWVAERLVAAARDRGLPARVYRPGRVSGHSLTGASSLDDFTCRFIKGCIQIGAIPEGDVEFDLTPVDYAAAAIVRIATRPGAPGSCYHLVNPRPARTTDLARAIRSLGFPLLAVPYRTWRERLLAQGGPSGRNPLYPVLSLFEDAGEQGPGARARLDDGECRAALAGSGIECPAPDRRLLRIYVQHLVRRGFVETPRARGRRARSGRRTIAEDAP